MKMMVKPGDESQEKVSCRIVRTRYTFLALNVRLHLYAEKDTPTVIKLIFRSRLVIACVQQVQTVLKEL